MFSDRELARATRADGGKRLHRVRKSMSAREPRKAARNGGDAGARMRCSRCSPGGARLLPLRIAVSTAMAQKCLSHTRSGKPELVCGEGALC